MGNAQQPDLQFEFPYGPATANMYAMAARRHMHQFGTTSEQLAWVKVAASHHAQHNPHAMLPKVVTVEEVVNSPMVADPLHRLDCCVISDGGGALVIAKPEIAKSLKRPKVKIIGVGEANKIQGGGVDLDLTYSGGRESGKAAFEMAGVKPSDIKYASIYDSFTITVVMQIEDLGFCEKGEGGKFVSDGNLISGVGKLPFNTDGGGLCTNHPGNRGGMTKVIEAVRQARGEAHPKVQVKNHDIVLAHGTGGSLGDAPRRRAPSSSSGSERRWPRKSTQRFPRRPAAEPYWEGAKAGKLLVKWCQDCKKPHHYPRGVCPHCLSTNLEWKQAKGTGEIYTYSIMHAAKPAYVIAYVTLDEGVSMMTNIVDCDPATVKVGQKVKVVFKPTEGGGKLPCFTPV